MLLLKKNGGKGGMEGKTGAGVVKKKKGKGRLVGSA